MDRVDNNVDQTHLLLQACTIKKISERNVRNCEARRSTSEIIYYLVITNLIPFLANLLGAFKIIQSSQNLASILPFTGGKIQICITWVQADHIKRYCTSVTSSLREFRAANLHK